MGYLEADAPLLVTRHQDGGGRGHCATDRFEPVTAGELVSLRIEISVLSPLEPIRPSDVEVGRHGLLLRHGARRGVLLPQVPVEHGWHREAFLAHTCLKAGLPPDTWKRPDVELLGFTATVFGEDD